MNPLGSTKSRSPPSLSPAPAAAAGLPHALEPRSFDAFDVVYIENEAKIAQATARYLELHGVRVTVAHSAREGITCVLREQPDVILLDLMLPDISGLEVCRILRERLSAPIVIVTGLCEEADRVMGLEGGADDYVTKPFSLRELLARVRAKARRACADNGKDTLLAGELTIERESRKAHWRGQPLSLTTYEFDLLRVFVERAGRPLSREQLMNLVRGSPDEAFERSVDVHVSHLRAKLGDDPRSPRLLKTVRGVGYMFATQFG